MRNNVAKAFEVSGYLIRESSEFEHFYHTPSDQETYAVGLKVVPTLFDAEPNPRHLSNSLSSLTRFDLVDRNVPPVSKPSDERVLILHELFKKPPQLLMPLAIGSAQEVKGQAERAQKLLKEVGFKHV